MKDGVDDVCARTDSHTYVLVPSRQNTLTPSLCYRTFGNVRHTHRSAGQQPDRAAVSGHPHHILSASQFSSRSRSRPCISSRVLG